ncbi:MAG: bZIP transcription factor [Planctomycetia bacterium]|nr:bZIP transcription factor [Planctomycetia bacterium]
MELFPLFFVFGAIALVIVFRVVAGSLDHQRIRDYVESRGGRLLSCHWSPFGTGWWGEKSDRIYEVSFRDRDGNLHHATCKTSMWTGVYWTEDQITQYGDRQRGRFPVAGDHDYIASLESENRRLMELEDENRRLREEITRLRRGQG